MPDNSSTKKKMSAQEQRELDVAIGFLEGVVGRDPEYFEALQVLGDDYTRRGLYESGLQVDQRLACLRPDDPFVQYNLACSFSLMEQYEQAAAALHRALDRGYHDFRWLARDPDLKKFRQQPLYKLIQMKVRSLKNEAG